ncbi:MAG: hypothetical protein ACREBN_04850 [Burkholderiaceae bacterium]
MRPRFLLAMCLFLPLTSYAATLQQVVQVLAAPAQKTDSPGDWARVNQLPGMKWKLPAPKQTPVGFTRYGSLKLDGLGQVTVYFIGDRAGAQQASISLPEGVDKREFTATLQRLIPSAKIKQLRGGCKDEGALGGSAVYQVDVPGAASVYATMMTGVSKAGMETELIIARQLDKNWKCA